MSQGNNTAEFWTGEEGDAYHARNRVNWRARIPFWREILDITSARSVYEWGCGPGWNLTAIQAAADWPVEVYGTDINTDAVKQALTAGLDSVEWDDIDGPFEIVLTAGALIHVPSEQLKDRMQCLVDASCDYVLAVEYESPDEEMIEYRGLPNLLWKRPYGELYQALGLKMRMVDRNVGGFDNCTAWLLRK